MAISIFMNPVTKQVVYNANRVKPGNSTVSFDTPVQPSDAQKAKLQAAIDAYIEVYDADDDVMYSAFDRMEAEFVATAKDIRQRM